MTMDHASSPFRFAVLLVPLLVILGWPSALVGRGFRSLVCGAIDSSIMNSTQTPKVARLVPDERLGREWHAIVAVWNQSTRKVEERFPVDLHQLFYMPAAVFTALTLAGKWTWDSRRTPWKLLAGIALFQLRPIPIFVARERAVVGLFQSDGLFDVLLVLFNRAVVAPLGMAYVLPLVLWFGLFRGSIVSGQKISSSPPPHNRTNPTEGTSK
jgi:hypothetical protein